MTFPYLKKFKVFQGTLNDIILLVDNRAGSGKVPLLEIPMSHCYPSLTHP